MIIKIHYFYRLSADLGEYSEEVPPWYQDNADGKIDRPVEMPYCWTLESLTEQMSIIEIIFLNSF